MSVKLRDLLNVLNKELDYEIFVDYEPVAMYDHSDYRLDFYLDLNVIEIGYCGEDKSVAIYLESKEEHEANLKIRVENEIKANAFDILANNFAIEIKRLDSTSYDIYISGYNDEYDSSMTINSYNYIVPHYINAIRKALGEVK